MSRIAITNNSLIDKVMSDGEIFTNILYKEISFLDVLLKAKEKIKDGYILITHPFIGVSSINEQPYKTLALLEGDGTLDFNSIKIIDYSIVKTKRAIETSPPIMWMPEDLCDFKKIDLIVTERWLRKIYFKM